MDDFPQESGEGFLMEFLRKFMECFPDVLREISGGMSRGIFEGNSGEITEEINERSFKAIHARLP